jgi:hypothetical protein
MVVIAGGGKYAGDRGRGGLALRLRLRLRLTEPEAPRSRSSLAHSASIREVRAVANVRGSSVRVVVLRLVSAACVRACAPIRML